MVEISERSSHRDVAKRGAVTTALALGLLLSTVTSGGYAAEPASERQSLEAVVGGNQRSPDHVERDRYRHPLQTLTFFGIRSDMTVLEVFPGGGWYTEILAPYLRERGHLIEANYPTSSDDPFMRKMALRFGKKLAAAPEVYGDIGLQPFAPPDYVTLGPPATVDMIVTFRNMHDLVYENPHGGVTDAVMARFFRAAYLALRPGGVMGIVAHRAAAGRSVSESSKQGRLPQAYVVREAEQAGFRLGAESSVNANPSDPGDIPVWYLPPSLSGPEKDRSDYVNIGESDRMTLRFTKPAD